MCRTHVLSSHAIAAACSDDTAGNPGAADHNSHPAHNNVGSSQSDDHTSDRQARAQNDSRHGRCRPRVVDLQTFPRGYNRGGDPRWIRRKR